MRKASVTETKNRLSALLERVRAGESVVITDRRIPIAILEPVRSGDNRLPSDARLARLERAGVIHSGARRIPERLFDMPTARAKGSAVKALLTNREEDR
ncbi:MAG: type II toxin-antitoxin system prevent-host-death family antitoxin [Nitrospirae bacterium]|nr:type II toxin-antitoxin system prevent-host-death family antitoxin [Nitrospirota bacterium]